MVQSLMMGVCQKLAYPTSIVVAITGTWKTATKPNRMTTLGTFYPILRVSMTSNLYQMAERTQIEYFSFNHLLIPMDPLKLPLHLKNIRGNQLIAKAQQLCPTHSASSQSRTRCRSHTFPTMQLTKPRTSKIARSLKRMDTRSMMVLHIIIIIHTRMIKGGGTPKRNRILPTLGQHQMPPTPSQHCHNLWHTIEDILTEGTTGQDPCHPRVKA
mmetsp:Transcript_35258/g.59860  ORF Transcript_35258/g.59860 Transcript_35258/m.59860 type:complete len:213 (+) Transcript_35258:681-1319(+)